jgi:hypothetical protein
MGEVCEGELVYLRNRQQAHGACITTTRQVNSYIRDVHAAAAAAANLHVCKYFCTMQAICSISFCVWVRGSTQHQPTARDQQLCSQYT